MSRQGRKTAAAGHPGPSHSSRCFSPWGLRSGLPWCCGQGPAAARSLGQGGEEGTRGTWLHSVSWPPASGLTGQPEDRVFLRQGFCPRPGPSLGLEEPWLHHVVFPPRGGLSGGRQWGPQMAVGILAWPRSPELRTQPPQLRGGRRNSPRLGWALGALAPWPAGHCSARLVSGRESLWPQPPADPGGGVHPGCAGPLPQSLLRRASRYRVVGPGASSPPPSGSLVHTPYW